MFGGKAERDREAGGESKIMKYKKVNVHLQSRLLPTSDRRLTAYLVVTSLPRPNQSTKFHLSYSHEFADGKNRS